MNATPTLPARSGGSHRPLTLARAPRLRRGAAVPRDGRFHRTGFPLADDAAPD